MIDHKKLGEYIRTLEGLLVFLKDYQKKQREDYSSGDYLLEFHNLKNLVRSSEWPAAIPPDMLCNQNSDEDKFMRASNILGEMVSLKDLAFLDFGCGEGHVVAASLAQEPRFSLGYDMLRHPSWDHLEGVFTNGINIMRSHAPYDVVLLYDVLDHAEDPIQVLEEVKSVRKSNGPIYVRCHPWTSRHATHLYHQINKAFLHLVFSEKELLKLGFKGMKTIHLLSPQEHYHHWFRQAGLEIKHELVRKTPLEDFFKHPLVHQRLRDNHEHFPASCEIDFIDYLLA
jgi:2-polyprenyl-3-methyl-5-hydroxy-6-metoxy-1,4-benzoquinol methylase